MTRISGDDRARLLSKIDMSAGQEACWPFTGAKTGTGYGNFWIKGQYRGAHRVVWLLLVGPIPEGLEVDHDCHNRDKTCPGGSSCIHRSCVNWKHHLRLATHKENGNAGRSGPIDQCLRGHPYDNANTYWHGGKKFCRACRHVEDPTSYLRSLEVRRKEAVRMRSDGATLERIAQTLGYANRSAARNAIMLQVRKGENW